MINRFPALEFSVIHNDVARLIEIFPRTKDIDVIADKLSLVFYVISCSSFNVLNYFTCFHSNKYKMIIMSVPQMQSVY